MHAKFNEKDIPLGEITLDDFGWDNLETEGKQELFVYCSKTDLKEIGAHIYTYACACIEEEPDYFTDEYSQDIPLPLSETVFLENPLLLAYYLEDSFWSRETIIAILDQMRSEDYQRETRNYWIKNFKKIQIINEEVEIKFGVWVQSFSV